MSSDSRRQREELKQQYKEHYREMRDAKERYKRTKKKKNIVDALKNMDSTELMESFDSFLFEVQSKVARAEARLDVALESLDDGTGAIAEEQENEEVLNKQRAKETLKQLKNEMGILYSELEQQAEAINVDKTVGSAPEEASEKRSSAKE